MDIEIGKPEIVDTIVEDIKTRYGINKARLGIHMTDCLYCLRKAFWDKVDRLDPSPQETLYFILGLGSQDAIMGKDSAVGSQQGYELDGIAASPDLVVAPYGKPLPVELKTTRIGNKRLYAKDLPEGWIKQLMGYCTILSSEQGLLVVVPIIQPEIISFNLRFTPDELNTNWTNIKLKANMLQQSLDSNTVPDIPCNADWECKNCRYKLRCSTIRISLPEAKTVTHKLSELAIKESEKNG